MAADSESNLTITVLLVSLFLAGIICFCRYLIYVPTSAYHGFSALAWCLRWQKYESSSPPWEESSYLEGWVEFFCVSFDRTLNLLLNTNALCILILCSWLWHHLSPESAFSPETLFFKAVILELFWSWKGVRDLSPRYNLEPTDTSPGINVWVCFHGQGEWSSEWKVVVLSLYSEGVINPDLEPKSLYFQTSVVSRIYAPWHLLCWSPIITFT